MSKALRYFILGSSLIVLFYLDFIRDYVFKNIGFQIYYLEHLNSDGSSTIYSYTDSFIEKYIKNFSIVNLNNLKWFFTALFILLFGLLGSLINYFFYLEKKIAFYFILLYSFLSVSSIAIYLLMYFSDSYTFQMKTYLVSMEIAHFLQSSLPTLFFLVSYKFYKQSKS